MRHLVQRCGRIGRSGRVLVIETAHRHRRGRVGGVLSNAAQAAGVEGVIVDGPARDIDEAAELGFPVYARGATARTARGRIYEEGFNIDVTVGELTVHPGDLIIADRSGVAVVPEDRAEDVMGKAESIVARERAMTEAVRRGQPVSEVMGASYERMLQQGGDD